MDEQRRAPGEPTSDPRPPAEARGGEATRRSLRIAGFVVLGMAIGLALVVALLFVITRTEFGLERVRRVAIARLSNRIEGELRVERITSRGLLGGAVLHDIELIDPRGRPFLRADSARLGYRFRTLLAGQIVFSRLSVYGPEVIIERLPGDTAWNFEYIFPDTTPDIEEDRDLILLDRVRIEDGLFIVRTPWEPDEPVEPDDTARLILREVPGGLVREFRFEEVNGLFPRVLWESPLEEGKLIRIASLSTRGYIWKDPFELRDLRGAVTIRDSLISFDVSRFEMPASRGSGVGRVVTHDGRTEFDVRIEGDDVAFADLQWLYPPLPDEGGGNLVFRMQTQPVGTLWLAEDARIRAPGMQLAGTFGIVTGDTLYFTQVRLRASPLNLELLQDVLPVDLPVEGLMVGTVEVEGPISSLTTRGDVRLMASTGRGQPAAATWSGTLDLRPPYGAQALEATVTELDTDRVPALARALRLRGVLSGRLQATGRLDHGLHFTTALEHRVGDGAVSALEGQGTLHRTGGEAAVDALFELRPVSLAALAAAFPELGRMDGDVHGPITVQGPLADLDIGAELSIVAGAQNRIDGPSDADLRLPAGQVRVEARLGLDGDGLSTFAGGGRLEDLRLDRLVDGLEAARVTASFELDGRGRAAGDAYTSIRVEIDSARIGPVPVQMGFAHIDVREGVARVDSLVLAGEAGRLEANGALGLEAGHPGTLEVVLRADAIDALRNEVFPVAAIVGEDSARYQLRGAAELRATLYGSLADLSAEGEARFERFAIRTVEAERAGARFSATGIGTDTVRYRIEAEGGDVRVHGRPLDQVRARIGSDAGNGYIELDGRAVGRREAEYRLLAGFRRDGGGLGLELREGRARDWAGDWRLEAPAAVRISETGIDIDELVLTRDDRAGTVRAAGRLPWRSEEVDAPLGTLPADFRLEIAGLPLAPLRLNGEDPPASAVLSGTVTVVGSAASPALAADLALNDVVYENVHIDRVQARIGYAARRMDARIEALHEGQPILTGQGRVPIDLTLAPIAERRLDEPLRFEFRAIRVPAAFAAGLVDGFRDVRGEIVGRVRVEGTTLEPSLAGELLLSGGEAVWAASGVRYRDVEGRVRALGDQVVGIELNARAGTGAASATGTLRFVPLGDPELDLTIRADEFLLARRRDVDATGTGEARLVGRYTRPRVEGRISVDRGVFYLDELWHQYQIIALDDPRLFAAVDTSLVAIRRALPTSTSPFVRNLEVDVTLDVERDTWLRGRNLDIEVAGNLSVEFDGRSENEFERGGDALRLVGTLNAIRGSYDFYLAETLPVRRFSVQEGTVEFDGTPGINPRLHIVATHRVRLQDRGSLDVAAVVSGSLRDPRLQLSSDAEPPIAESELLSLLVFGRPSMEVGRTADGGGLGTGLLADAGWGVAAPTLLGFGSTALQSFASNLGIFDHIAISEWAGGVDADASRNLLLRSQLEAGWYWGRDWYVAVSRRLAGAASPVDVGVRVEWRPVPTWTLELFREDRFGRELSLIGLDPSLQQQKVWGFSFFREWGK